MVRLFEKLKRNTSFMSAKILANVLMRPPVDASTMWHDYFSASSNPPER